MQFDNLIKGIKKIQGNFLKHPLEVVLETEKEQIKLIIIKEKVDIEVRKKGEGSKGDIRERVIFSHTIGKVRKVLVEKEKIYSEGTVVLEIFQPLIGLEKIFLSEKGKVKEIYVTKNQIIDFGTPLIGYEVLD